ncbi:hypothetical protein QBC43DRAFT_292744 [Cladorrhinum sp. PSN259]|nr:hypothetical protein QBC43DRAFT_292744 [Cladorrhinum sp. PSN259]
MTVITKLPAALASARKIVSPDRLRNELSKIRASATTRLAVVLVTGRFDLLQIRHVSLLERAAALGHILVVGVKIYLGSSSPQNSPVSESDISESPARIVAALGCVDFVVSMDGLEEEEERLVKLVAPDVIVLGTEKGTNDVAGMELVQKRGGHVVVLDEIDSVADNGNLKQASLMGML